MEESSLTIIASIMGSAAALLPGCSLSGGTFDGSVPRSHRAMLGRNTMPHGLWAAYVVLMPSDAGIL
jgi:hypothetical protein